MYQTAILLITMLCVASSAQAQGYTKHIQQQETGRAKVIVRQSPEIDDLVNFADVSADKPGTPATTHQDDKLTRKPATPNHNTPETPHKPAESTASHPREQPHHTETTHPTEAPKPETHTEESTEGPAIDTRRKVMRRSYKVRGYRVQVFAGGNSRDDKLKAQRAGSAIKAAFPNQPVYVHFYSPRWICRMGNFRSYEEASQVLREVQKLGYKQACIVSGQINVAY